MNVPGKSTGLDWAAIGIGAGVSLGVGYAGGFLAIQALTHGGGMATSTRWFALMPLVGLFADVLGGAAAGLVAKRRGATHGALASLAAAIAGHAIGMVRMAIAGAMAAMLSPWYWLQSLAWTVVGIGIAAAAGAIAASIAAKSAPPPPLE